MGGACARREPPPVHLGAAPEQLQQGRGSQSTGQGASGSADTSSLGAPLRERPPSAAAAAARAAAKPRGNGPPLQSEAATREGGTGGAPALVGQHGSLEDVTEAAALLVEEVQALERRRRDLVWKAQGALQSIYPSAKLVKALSVDGRLIIVVDGAVSDGVREQLFECLQTDMFRRTEFARPDTREFRHHVVEYNVDKLRRTELFGIVDRLVSVFFNSRKGPPLEVYRMYTNSVMFGDAAFVHRDSCDAEHVTVLAYPNPEWASELGGETVFYDEDGEIVEAVEPRPGRLVLFRGCILHKGSPPSRLFWGSRYTTAFKFAAAEDDDKPEAPEDLEPASTQGASAPTLTSATS